MLFVCQSCKLGLKKVLVLEGDLCCLVGAVLESTGFGCFAAEYDVTVEYVNFGCYCYFLKCDVTVYC